MRAVAAVVLAVLAACSVAIEDVAVPLDDLDLAPRRTTAAAGHVPTGPVVEVARGTSDGAAFQIVAWSEADGICIFAMSGADSTLACGPEPDPVGLLTTDAWGSDGPLEVVGAASAAVTAVVAELPDGRRGTGQLISLAPAGIDGSAFVLVLPPDVGDHDVVVRGADGAELDRLIFEGDG